MRYIFITLLSSFICIASNVIAQNTVKMSAVKSNSYGVVYSLPKTIITVSVAITKTVRKAGDFYEYAEHYLNIANPIIKDEALYSITNIEARMGGVPNRNASYLVEFKSGTIAPFVTLTKDGLICAINSDSEGIVTDNKNLVATQAQTKKYANPNTFLSEEILRAGSKTRQADMVAKQIFKLRETKTSILTGEADNMPPDGSAYKVVMEQIDEQEKALTSMFIGMEMTEQIIKEYTIIPDSTNIENEIVFRFSQKIGAVSSDDLSGVPVVLSLVSKEAPKKEMILSPKEQKELEKKFQQGIIYNIAGKADLKISYNNKVWVNKECDIVQFGTQDVLASKMFDNNKQPIKVIFFPELGAIKQIIQ